MIIWLDAPVELLKKRLAEDNTRPLLQETDLNLRLKTLDKERRSLYQKADLTIIINKNQTPEKIVYEILAKIPSVIKPKVEANQLTYHN